MNYDSHDLAAYKDKKMSIKYVQKADVAIREGDKAIVMKILENVSNNDQPRRDSTVINIEIILPTEKNQSQQNIKDALVDPNSILGFV